MGNQTLLELLEEQDIEKGMNRLEEMSSPYSSDIGVGYSILRSLYQTSAELPAWYSQQRDRVLYMEMIRNPFLNSVVEAVKQKLMDIPFTIVPKDTSVNYFIKQATDYDQILQFSLFDEQTFDKFITSFLTYDNGAFLFVFNETDDASKPLTSPPQKLIHLDSNYVIRTGDWTHPYRYLHIDQQWYLLHRSRVISMVQQPSPLRDMFGVGYSGVSRLFVIARHLLDTNTLFHEYISGIEAKSVIWGTGATSTEIQSAFTKSELESFNEGRLKVGKNVYMGFRDPNASLNKFNMKSLPVDNWDVRDDIEISLTLAALALQVSPGLLMDSIKSGSTKASAANSTTVGESKLPGMFSKTFKHQIQNKFCNQNVLCVTHHNIDPDGTQAKIYQINANKRKTDIESGVSNIRTEREKMVANNELSVTQFINLELADGRLENGLPIESIFSTTEATLRNLIYFIPDPLDFDNNTYDEIKDKLIEYIKQAEALSLNGKSITTQRNGRQALYALKWVLQQYEKIANQQLVDENSLPNVQISTTDSDSYQDEVNQLMQEPAEEQEADGVQKEARYRFTTVKDRQFRQNLHQQAKALWNGSSTKANFIEAVQSICQNYECIEPYYDRISEICIFIDNNSKSKSGKLSMTYAFVDSLIDFLP